MPAVSSFLAMPAVSSFLASLSADASPSLNAACLAFSSALISAFSQGFWFVSQVTVLGVVTSSAHLEMKPRMEEVYFFQSTSPSQVAVSLKTCWSVCALKTVLEYRGCITGPHSDCLLCWPDPSQQGTVCWCQQDADVVGEAKMGPGKSSVHTVNVAVHTFQSLVSPCRKGDMLVKTGRSVCQFHVI